MVSQRQKDIGRYREKAEELRLTAAGMKDATARNTTLYIARGYDDMAANLEIMDRSGPAPKKS